MIEAHGTRLTSEWPIYGEREREVLVAVLESGEWGHVALNEDADTGGFQPWFEREFAELHDARHGVCVANGTVALQLALEALDIGAGDEVIVPGLTWQATAASVLDVNAVPILVDVEPDTYCLDPAAVEAAIGARTRAVIAVHLYNCLADLDRLVELCERHGLALIEDCAHSHGSTWNGRGVGSFGAVGTFSFQSSKCLTSGEGGICLTSDDRLRDRLDALRNCGREPASAGAGWGPVQSGNYRLTEWQAAILVAQLERFPAQLRRREESAQLLDLLFAEVKGVATMRRREQVTRQGLFAYVLRCDSDAFGGRTAARLGEELSQVAGIPVWDAYESLDDSPLYQPLSKRRHRLPGQLEEIDPRRFELPVSRRARDEALVIPQQVLLSEPEAMSALVDAVVAIRG